MAAGLLSVQLQMQVPNDNCGLHMLDPRNRKQSHPLKVQTQFLEDGPYEIRACSLAHFPTTVPKGTSCSELDPHPKLEDA
jgi:hypothetical protein